MADAIQIVGLNEFRNNLRELDKALPKMLRLAFNEAADIIVTDARGRVVRRSGRAASTVKVRSTQSYARVSGGGNKAPYYPWLDFGGQIGNRSGKARGRRGRRPFIKDGRYIYRAYFDNTDRFVEVMEKALHGVAQSAGIEVTDG